MDKIYTVNETLSILKISRPTLYELIKKGTLRPVKLGKRTLFKESELERFINDLQQVEPPE